MEELDAHRIKVKEIADFAFGYGLETVGFEEFKRGVIEKKDPEIQKKFIIACHDGFKKAQNLLIEEIIKYQALYKEATKQLKEYRREREKTKEKETKREIEIIKKRLSTFSHIADGLAWNVIGGQIHVARRLYIEEDSSKFLESSNIEHAIEVSTEINKNPLDFALISDLTNYVQIGDLLIKHENIVGIMELKQGKVNDLIAEFFDTLNSSGEKLEEIDLAGKFDEKTVKQINRMQRQQERAIRATEIINTDKGTDPVSGENIFVGTPTIATKYYHKELTELQTVLEKEIWSYTLIENCLHVGMYRDKGIAMAGFVIEHLLKEQTENYLLIDWLSIINNLSEPIFAKPFPPDFIIDILTGKVKVIIGLNVDNFIELIKLFGLKARWLSRKETAKFQQESKRKGMFVINNKGISVETSNGQEVILSGGTFSKILYDNIKPSSVILSIDNIDFGNHKNNR